MRLALLTASFVVLSGLAFAQDSAPTVPSLIKDLESPDLKTRQGAIRKLGELGPKAKDAAPALVKALDEWRLRKLARDALVKIGPEARKAIIAGFRENTNYQVSDTLETVLSRLGPEIVPELMQAIKGTTEERTASNLLNALAKLGADADAAVPMLESLVRRPRMRLTLRDAQGKWHPVMTELISQRAAADCLKELGPKGTAALKRISQDRRSQLPHWWTLPKLALDYDACQRAEVFYGQEFESTSDWLAYHVPRAWRELVDPGWGGRAAAAEALGGKAHLDWLLAHLNSPDLMVRKEATSELWRIVDYDNDLASPAWLPTIAKAFRSAEKDPSLWVSGLRQTGIHENLTSILLCMGPPGEKWLAKEGIPILLRGLKSRNEDLRIGSSSCFLRLGPKAESAFSAVFDIARNDAKGRRRDEADDRWGLLTEQNIIGNMGPIVLPRLIEKLEKGTEREKIVAVECMAMMGRQAKKALPTLREILRGDDVDLCIAALFALGELGKRAAPALPEVQRAIKNPDLALHAARTMLNLDPDALEPVLLLAKELEEHPGLIRRIAELGPRGRPARASLLAWFGNRNRFSRKWAANALRRIDPDGLEPLVKQLVEELRAGDLRDATDLLAEFGPAAKPAVPALLAAWKNEKSTAEDKEQILRCLQAIGPEAEPALPVLIEALEGEATNVVAAEILGRLGKDAAPAVPQLVDMLDYPDKDSRTAAIEALGKIGPKVKGVLPALRRALDSPDKEDREEAARALGLLGEAAKEAIPRLKELASESHVVVQALFRLTGDEKYVEALAEIVEKNYHSVAPLLGELGPEGKAAVPALRKALKSKDFEERLFFAQALEKIGKESAPAVPELIAMLDNPHPHCREAGARALAAIGPAAAKAVPRLVVLEEEEPEQWVADAAEEALRRIQGRRK